MKRIEPALYAGFLAVLAWAPMPFASNRPWSAALLFILLAALTCIWLSLYIFRRVEISEAVWRQARLSLVILALVQSWVLVQTLPLPPQVVELLSPQASSWHISPGWRTLSLDPEKTHFYLLKGCAISLGFLLVVLLVNSWQRVNTLLWVLVLSGTAQALYGSFMVLSGMELGFFVEKYVNTGLATGTFINRNHMAGYLVLCLSAGSGLLLSNLSKNSSRSWRDRVRNWLTLLLSPKMRLRFFLAVMVIALLLTRSRMGNIAFFAALTITGGLVLLRGHRFRPRVLVFIASLLLVDMLLVGQWFGFEQVADRLQQSELSAEPRNWSNRDTLQMLKDFPLTGAGGGSFYGVFPNYQSRELVGKHQHAHNDYLEFAAELGVPATIALAMLVVLAFRSAWSLLSERRNSLGTGVGFAVIMAITWAAIHSTVDFNLQIPANALTFSAMLALANVTRHSSPFAPKFSNL